MVVSICQPCHKLATCPGCTQPMSAGTPLSKDRQYSWWMDVKVFAKLFSVTALFTTHCFMVWNITWLSPRVQNLLWWKFGLVVSKQFSRVVSFSAEILLVDMMELFFSGFMAAGRKLNITDWMLKCLIISVELHRLSVSKAQCAWYETSWMDLNSLLKKVSTPTKKLLLMYTVLPWCSQQRKEMSC